MRLRDPFGLSLSSLRTALEEGLAPGQHLPAADIAASLKLSTSPVREALSRLCGEGLIEDRRGLGYFTRPTPVEDLVGLLELEAAHLRLAASGAPPPRDGSDSGVEAWMVEVVESCENQPLVESLSRVRQRLTPLRRLQGPIAAVEGSFGADPIEAYYARWRAAVPALAARIRRLDPQQSEYTRNIV
jgi:DNA-binding Lrp family transcriptional regulator